MPGAGGGSQGATLTQVSGDLPGKDDWDGFQRMNRSWTSSEGEQSKETEEWSRSAVVHNECHETYRGTPTPGQILCQ